MEESYVEGVAVHNGRELCVGVREGVGEASAAVRTGRVIEPRNRVSSGCRRRHGGRKATPPRALSASCGRTPRGRRSRARTEPL
jgi:hypothetical protein